MAVIHPVPVDDPDVSLFRPDNPDGFWTIEVDGTRSHEVRWHGSQNGGDVQMRVGALRALRDALNRELADAVPATVPSMDEVPVFVTGLPGVPMFGVPAIVSGEAGG